MRFAVGLKLKTLMKTLKTPHSSIRFVFVRFFREINWQNLMRSTNQFQLSIRSIYWYFGRHGRYLCDIYFGLIYFHTYILPIVMNYFCGIITTID